MSGFRKKLAIHFHDGSLDSMMTIISVAKPEVVFHLASKFIATHRPVDVETLIDSNVKFSAQLVEAMVANDVSFLVNTATSWQHQKNSIYDPSNLYAASKQAFEDVLAYYTSSGLIRAITLVLFDTYGPNDPRPKLLALIRRSLSTGQRLDMSPGLQEIDLVHVDDVVRAFVCAGTLVKEQKNFYERYGVASGNPMNLRSLVRLIEGVSGEAVNVNWGGRSYRSREVMESWSAYKKLPGWSPSVPLEEGLKRLFSWDKFLIDKN